VNPARAADAASVRAEYPITMITGETVIGG
jgi:hypothetical protein